MNKNRIFAVLAASLIACGSGNNQPTTAPSSATSTSSSPPVLAVSSVAPVASSVPPIITADPVPPPRELVGRKVLIVGDSEACAVKLWIDTPKLVALINDEEHQPHDTVDIECKGGTRVSYWGKGGHLRMALQAHPSPDAVVVFLGGNHYHDPVVPETETITDQLKETNCVWVGNAELFHQKWPINGMIRDKVTPQCQYFDTEAASIPLADGAHPTPEGATKWIRLIWPLIPLKYKE